MERSDDTATARQRTGAGGRSAGLEALFFDPIIARNAQTQLRGKMAEYAVVAFFVLFLAAYEWLRTLVPAPRQPVWMSGFALAITAYCAVRIGLLFPRWRALKAGQQMWRMMQVDFSSLGQHGFFLFDGLSDDHGTELGLVLIGPTGIFSLNIRTNTPTGAFREKIDHIDAHTLLIGGRPALADPLGQARLAAARVQRHLESKGFTGCSVTPILVYPGWTLGRRPADDQRNVIVASEQSLAPEVLTGPATLQPKDLILLCEILDPRQLRPPGG